jgi:ABC-type polar amino acid transport system ATPase subunit
MVTGVTEVETVAEIVAETDLVDRLEEILVIDLLVVILAAVVIEVEIVVLDQVEAALEAEMTEVEVTEVVTAEVAAGIEVVTEITVVAEIIGAVVEDHLVGIDAGKLLGQRFNKNNLEHNRKTNGSKEPCIR